MKGTILSMNNAYDYEKKDVPSHIRGIYCNVKNCSYHDGENYCTANKINVGPSFATNCTDTVCSTFKQKNFGK